MANREHVKYLINAANITDGRKKWLDYKLSRKDMDLNGIDLSNEDMHDFDFSDLDLKKANFYNADLSGVDFSDARLDGADFRRAVLIGSTFDRASLKGGRFQGAVLSDACLEGADLTDASLQGADLTGADLGEARLAGTDMRQAILKYTRMSGAVLDKANVAEADLTGSVMDDGAPTRLRNFDLAVVDDRKYRVMRSKVQATVVPVEWEDTARFTVAPGAANPPPSAAPPPPPPPPQPPPPPMNGGAAHMAGRNPDSTVEFVMHTPPPPHAEPQSQAEAQRQAEAEREERRKATHNESKFRRRATDEDTASKKKSGEDSKSSREGMRRFFFRDDTPKPRKPTADNPLALVYVATDADLATDDGCAKVLGVRITDSPGDITKAFRALAKVLHPDKVNHHPPEVQAFARDQFELCHRAHDRLKRRTASSASAIVWVEGIPRRRSPYEHTIDELEKLVRVNPGNDGLVYNLAWKHYEVGNLDQAIFYFERSVTVNPANEDAHVNLKAAKLQKALRSGGGY